MFARFGQKTAGNTQRSLFQQSRRNLSVSEEAPQFADNGYPFIFPVIGVSLLWATSVVAANASAPIYYPAEAEELVREYKAGLRNADFSPKARSVE